MDYELKRIASQLIHEDPTLLHDVYALLELIEDRIDARRQLAYLEWRRGQREGAADDNEVPFSNSAGLTTIHKGRGA